MTRPPLPLLGICAQASGAGKTALITALIPLLNQRGIRVSVIKHAHHRFDVDHPGKDSYQIRAAGAVQTMLGSRQRWALMTELAEYDLHEPDLDELAAQMDASLADLILVEGFKQAPIPKIEVHRPVLGYPLLATTDAHIIAVASDVPVAVAAPLLDLNTPATIADFIQQWLRNTP